MSKLDFSTVYISEFGGFYRDDWPDLSDLYAAEAQWWDETPLTDVELDELNSKHKEIVHEKFMASL